MARPKRGNYAYGPEGDARYKKNLREYLKKQKEAREKKTKIESTKKNISKQKTANKKAATTTKPKSSAAKGKSLATTKRPGMTKAEKQEMLKGNSLQDKEKALKTTKTRTKTRTQTKSKTTTKPVTKKPVAKKPVAKKPVAKKPAGKVPAKKPLISNKNKLRIKKAANTAADTTKKVVKKGVEQSKKVASNVKKKVDATKKAIKKYKAPRPKTGPQKFVSKVTRGAKSYGKTLLKKGGKDLLKIGKGIVKNPGSAVSGLKGAGAAYLAEKGINQLTDRAFKQLRKETRGKNMTLKEYRARVDKANKEIRKKYGIIPTAKKLINKVQGESGESSTTKNINKQKKVNNKTPKTKTDLQIAKDRVKKAKGYNKEKLQREVRYQEKFGKQGRTWSNPVGAEGKGKPSSGKTEKPKDKLKSKWIRTSKGTLARRGTVTARRAENRERARKRAQEMARERKRKKQNQ